MMVRKLESIQSLRGIAVLLVVLYHISEYELKLGYGHLVTSNFYRTGAAGVDMFFILSGFVMYYITYVKKNKTKVPSFLINRALRIYPLYWIYSFIILIILLKSPELFTRPSGIEQVSYIKSFLLIPDNGAPILGQGWTLIFEMYFYLVFGVMLFFKSIRLRNWALLLWFLCLIIINYVLDATVLFSLSNQSLQNIIAIVFSSLSIEFILGCGLAWLYLNKELKYAKIAIVAGIVIFLLIGYNTENQHLGERVISYGIPSFLLVYGLVGMYSERESGLIMSYLAKIGDASYSIYLSHVLVLSGVVYIAKKINTTSSSVFIILVVMLLLTLIVGFLSYHILEKKIIYPLVARVKK